MNAIRLKSLNELILKPIGTSHSLRNSRGAVSHGANSIFKNTQFLILETVGVHSKSRSQLLKNRLSRTTQLRRLL